MPDQAAFVMWSGGKDSCLACHKALRQGYDVRALLNLSATGPQPTWSHGRVRDLLARQAALMGIPLVQIETTPSETTLVQACRDAMVGFRAQGLATAVMGDIALKVAWLDEVLASLGIAAFRPLWERPWQALLTEVVAEGFEAIIVRCCADILGPEYLGRKVDVALAQDLAARGISPTARLVYHSLVVGGPLFSRPLEILKAEVCYEESECGFWTLDIQEFR